MQPHSNLFDDLGSKAAVYRKLQQDYLRDHKYCRWCQLLFGIFLGASYLASNAEAERGLFVLAALSAVQFLVLFIDQSNRNFLMHAIDWMEAQEASPTDSL